MFLVQKNEEASSTILTDQGLSIVVYVDDGLIAVSGFETPCKVSQLAHVSPDNADFVAQPSKLLCMPSGRVDQLGFVVELVVQQIKLFETKIVTLRDRCSVVYSHAY